MSAISIDDQNTNAIWLKAINDSSIDACICVDPDLRILAFNKTAERILGFHAHEVLGRKVSDFWPDDLQLTTLLGAIQDNFVEDLPVSSRVRQEFGFRRDGSRFPMEIAVTPMEIDQTQIALISIRDRSELAASNHDAKRLAAFHNSLMESSLSARLIIDQDGIVVACNHSAKDTLGFTREELIGQSMADMIVPIAYRDAHNQGLQRYLATGHGPVLDQRIEISALHKQGHEFPVELTVSPVKVDDRSYFSAEVRDISERVQIMQELEAAKLQAELSNQAKSNFLATMSHEIRTPLNAVIGILSLVRAETQDPRRLELLNTAERSGKNLLEIISDVLDYSKIEAGQMSVDDDPFSMLDVIEEVIALFANSAYSKGLDFVTYIDPAAPTEMSGDKAKVGQVLRNFVSNAIKFTESGHIAVTLTREDSKLVMHVDDTGIGMTDENCQAVLEAFVQADDSDSRLFGGTGLGLSISRQLLEMMEEKFACKVNCARAAAFLSICRYAMAPLQITTNWIYCLTRLLLLQHPQR